MHSRRYQRGHGQDIIGMTVMQRNAQERSFRDTKTTHQKGGDPSPDPRVGSRVAHVGLSGAPTIYEEKRGGRSRGRGKRVQ